MLFIILFLIIGSRNLYASDNPLIGEWVSIARSKGGLGASRAFSADGTVIVTYGALIDFNYKTTGNILSLYNENGELVSEHEFMFSGTNLVLIELTTGRKDKLTRVEGELAPTIIGKWIGEHYTGGKKYLHFTEGQNCYFAVPFIQEKAKYKVNGDEYIEESVKKGLTEWKVRIEGNLLTLKKKDGSKLEEYKKK